MVQLFHLDKRRNLPLGLYMFSTVSIVLMLGSRGESLCSGQGLWSSSVFAGALAPCPSGCDVQEGLKLPGLGATLNEV